MNINVGNTVYTLLCEMVPLITTFYDLGFEKHSQLDGKT